MFILAAEGHEANSFWLPHDINEVIWGSIAFFLIAAALWLKALPFAKAALTGRSERIGTEISEAESLKGGAETDLATLQTQLANADSERQRIIADAQQSATTLQAQLVARAEQDAADVRARGVADAESAKGQAIADLQAEVAALALGAAERVVTGTMDDATQQSLIDGYISQVGSQTPGGVS